MRKILIAAIIILPVVVIQFSCSLTKVGKEKTAREIVIFPQPPDTTRIQFLTKISNSADITGRRNAFARFILGEEQVKPINKPFGIAIHKGKIYITDTFIKGFDVVDLDKGTFEYFIPTGRGQLKQPLNCFVDENGYLYVADGGRMQIVVFDPAGKYVTSFGEKENFRPIDVFIYDQKIWVANVVGHKINVYNRDSTYKLLYSFPESVEGSEHHLYSPTNIYVNRDKVFVTDFGDFKVKMYSHEGIYLDSLGTYGENVGQFSKPKGISGDRESNLYVVDAAFENVQVFNKEGRILMFFGGNYIGPGYMWLPAKVIIDYDNLKYFQKYVDPSFSLKYLILVTNQYGPDKVSIYGFVGPSGSSQPDPPGMNKESSPETPLTPADSAAPIPPQIPQDSSGSDAPVKESDVAPSPPQEVDAPAENPEPVIVPEQEVIHEIIQEIPANPVAAPESSSAEEKEEPVSDEPKRRE